MSAGKQAGASWPVSIQAFASATCERKCFSFAEKHKLLEAARWQRDILAAARLFPREKIYCLDY